MKFALMKFAFGENPLYCTFWCLHFFPKKERKHVDKSSKVEFVRLFVGMNVALKNTFLVCHF